MNRRNITKYQQRLRNIKKSQQISINVKNDAELSFADVPRWPEDCENYTSFKWELYTQLHWSETTNRHTKHNNSINDYVKTM